MKHAVINMHKDDELIVIDELTERINSRLLEKSTNTGGSLKEK